MKQAASILFGAILLFNLYGYEPLFNYLRKAEDKALTEKMQYGLNEESLLSIRVATTLPPYANDSREFEWADGEVLLDGVVYKYVKRRIYKDSIEYLCIAHEGRMKVENAREQFFRLCNDLQSSSTQNKKANSVAKPFSFEAVAQGLPSVCSEQVAQPAAIPLLNEKNRTLCYGKTPAQPPEEMVG